MSAHNPCRVRPQLEIVPLDRLVALAGEPSRLVPPEALLVLGPDVGIYCSGVNVTAGFREETGTRDNVFECGSGEAEGTVGGEQGERLDVYCVVRRVERYA